MEGEVVVVKDEDEDEAAAAAACPQPMAGLQDAAPAPFLMKTFEMVEDPETDAVVSWSRARNSFVVWEPHRFATALLPRYFKHSNFCSFIRQLNTYGFRKVDPDRWEFANEKFLGGQKHLLKDIKRRRNVGQSSQQQQGAGASVELGQGSGTCVEPGEFGLGTEVDRLRRDRSILMAEIVRLKQQQQNSRAQLLAMEERFQGTERKRQQTTAFLVRALKNPVSVQQLLLQSEQKKRLESVGQKRRLSAIPSSENLQANEGVAIELEIENLFSALDKDVSSTSRDQKDKAILESSTQNIGFVSDVMWEEFLDEGLLTGNDIEQGDQPEIEVEVEDLVAKPCDSGEDVKDLVEQWRIRVQSRSDDEKNCGLY